MPRAIDLYGEHEGLIGLSILMDAVDANINAVVINTALKVHEFLRSNPPVGTPIDTGWASKNWHLTLDVPSDFPPHSARHAMSLGLSPPDSGIAKVQAFDINKNTAIYCQNNTPYIARLNRGWGRNPQSPSGFVEMAIDAATVGMMVE